MEDAEHKHIRKLTIDLHNTRVCLSTALAWIAQSANSPISIHELKELYVMMNSAELIMMAPTNPTETKE